MKKIIVLIAISLMYMTISLIFIEPVNEHTETIIVAEPIPVEISEVVEVVPESKSLGEFKLTAYCSCSKCCGEWANKRTDGVVRGSTGKELTAGYSVAVDPEVIPYDTVLIIDGKSYKAMDCGGAIKGNRIDVYFNEHNEALNFGVQYAEVFLEMEDL